MTKLKKIKYIDGNVEVEISDSEEVKYHKRSLTSL